MKKRPKLIQLTYDEVLLLYTEASANSYNIYNSPTFDGGEIYEEDVKQWEQDPYRLAVIKLYEKLQKNYNWEL